MIAKVQAGLAISESEGLRRMRELHGGSRDGLEVSPNLWAGVGLVRGGTGTALVGSHTEVADRIEEYARLGISEFILSGYPHLEEAYWFGEGVLPILAARGVWRHPALDLFIEKGFDGTSLREIAEPLGFTKAALYYQPASRPALQWADGCGAAPAQ